MNNLKFELICKDDGGSKKVITIKNVSTVIVSNFRLESFDLIYHDGEREIIWIDESLLPTSLGPNEMKEIECSNPILQQRSVGYNKIQLVFTVEDDQSNKYRCVATKNVEDKRTYLSGPWDINAYIVD